MKKIFLYASAVFVIAGCNNNDATTTARKQVKQYSIAQLYKTKNIGGGLFNKDESKILVQNNETGIYNLYEIGLADTVAKQLTNSTKESFFAVDYVAGTDKTLYNADQGGNENSHIYLRQPDGTVKDLTPGEKEKATFSGWNKAKSSMYYTSNKRDTRFFDLYKMDTAQWKSSMMYKNDSSLDVGAISYNEKYLLLTKSITTDKNEMYLYDLKKK